ncbi:MAG: hypothetical protein KBD24_02150 [Candidatus Pacebacteria bacterium]|nr:hypothetical protein [Candidatus Paceibacterota bacterium]
MPNNKCVQDLPSSYTKINLTYGALDVSVLRKTRGGAEFDLARLLKRVFRWFVRKRLE